MRPSRLLVTLVLLLTGLTVLLVLAIEDVAAVLIAVWGGLAMVAMVEPTEVRGSKVTEVWEPQVVTEVQVAMVGMAVAVGRPSGSSRLIRP